MAMTSKWLKLKHKKIKGLPLLLIFLALSLIGCGETGISEEEGQETITIFAASSLTEAVSAIGEIYEIENSETDFRVNFAGSKTLRTQLENGAQADIFLSANKQHYDALLEQGILSKGKEILQNEMVLVLSKEGAEKIKTLEDLKNPHQLILAEKGVPAGDYGREVIYQLGKIYGEEYASSVLGHLASSENNVRQVLMKIVLGEGDVAIVYKTDVTEDIRDQVVMMEIPKDQNVTASYWMGIVNNDMISESVRDCYEFFTGEESCEVFESNGFSIVE